MITLQAPLIDCHGINYTAPVIMIGTANYNSNSSLQATLQDDSYTSGSHSHHSVSYQAHIWLDAEKKAAGLRPLFLRDMNGNDWHNIQLTEPVTNAAALVALCEQHVMSTIVPQLTVQAQE